MIVRIGVICPSEIAFRRFMPAVKNNKAFVYVGVAYASAEEWFEGQATNDADRIIAQEKNKAVQFQEMYGGQIFGSYYAMLESDQVDAIYIPLPPALHYRWAKKALQSGKHVFVEKPSTTSLAHTQELVEFAAQNELALHENYMFMFHPQIRFITEQIRQGILGEVWLYRIAFGFPFRGTQDFRYDPVLGGGATLDCGGYTLKLATYLLGNENVDISEKRLHCSQELGVDMFASATLRNQAGTAAQVSFGMDNSYKCQLEVWGSKGFLTADRIFTAPPNLSPVVQINCTGENMKTEIEPFDQFGGSLTHFYQCIQDRILREKTQKSLIQQSVLVENILHH